MYVLKTIHVHRHVYRRKLLQLQPAVYFQCIQYAINLPCPSTYIHKVTKLTPGHFRPDVGRANGLSAIFTSHNSVIEIFSSVANEKNLHTGHFMWCAFFESGYYMSSLVSSSR